MTVRKGDHDEHGRNELNRRLLNDSIQARLKQEPGIWDEATWSMLPGQLTAVLGSAVHVQRHCVSGTLSPAGLRYKSTHHVAQLVCLMGS